MLIPLPGQPVGVPWPGATWPEAPVPPGVALEPLLGAAFDPEGPLATTYAVVVVHRGWVVADRYGGALPHFDRAPEPVEPETPLLSWSMAKSMLHAVVGMLVAEGRLDLDAPVPVAAWSGDEDPRCRITLAQLLAMRDGLVWAEDYVDAGVSDVIEMLFGRGREDVAGFAADRALAAPPGTRFNYSSGTSNLISGLVREVLGGRERYERLLVERLFGPIGMRSARASFDAAGTWVASSYVHATARDFARFGLLYLRDGIWAGRRVLPEGWVDRARTWQSTDPDGGKGYGEHWWVTGDDHGTFWANGYEGQSILVCPALDLVVVRLGRTDAEHYPELAAWRAALVEQFVRAVP